MKLRREPVATDRRFRSSQSSSDYGTFERWQHSGRILEITERAGILAARALEEHALDVLVLRGRITEAQRDAAFRLKKDFISAGMKSRIIGSYNPSRSSFSPFGTWNERSDDEEAAYKRWRDAICAIGGLFESAVIAVTCYDIIPSQRQAVCLKLGLEKLVKWYRLPEE